ncbi:hypothetical protein [Deinococcus cellulosilyticus]|uniref:Uncharacterized protein n=1 Tax=Deinococcus cellulosilyticus (strain DSM 18568 / NBRC 106333 / KACC 11606 / 5516J-15) TaxID=1223518 RepID=A0A511N9Z7_DEIC1|nr:hypothetical protein [Deinococcus cellulosilyticus]GEM49630.1 hypothetical protein DC3_52650 [Deinococcus cellulosilyticus NBRC 106333 = KACC 11606]
MKYQTLADAHAQIQENDIFMQRWGYDQTNVDFVQVVKVTRRRVWVRPIDQQEVKHGSMTAEVLPLLNHFTGEARVKKPYLWNGEVRLVVEHGSCRKWDGQPKQTTSYA